MIFIFLSSTHLIILFTRLMFQNGRLETETFELQA